MKIFQRIVVLALLAVLVLGITGCSGSGELAIDIDRNVTDKKLQYTMFAHELAAYSAENRVMDKWEEMFNVEFTLDGSGSDWMQTLSLRVNSDDMPDLFFFVPNNINYMTAYTNFVEKQLLLPLNVLATREDTPYLYEYINSPQFDDLRIDGNLYFVPSYTGVYSNTIYVRQDWLDNLGMKEPTTIEEFEEMLRAFTEDDPDRNGRKDTYGMTASKVFEWLQFFRSSFGVQPGWSKDQDGQWQHEAFTQEYTDFLMWIKKLYEKGYIKNEFYLYENSDSLNDFYNGKCGVLMYNGGRATGGVTYNMRRLNKEAVVNVLPLPDGVAQGGYVTNGDWWGGWSIAYSAEEPMRLAKFLDYLLSPDGMNERLYGLEGIHYTKDTDGSIVLNFEERLKEPKFFAATDDGLPRGYYSIGPYFGSPFKMENGYPVDNTDSCIYSEPELANKSVQYGMENLLRYFPQETLHLGEEYAKIYSKVADRVYSYSIRIIAGNISLEDGLAQMKAAAESDGYAKLQKILSEAYPDK